MKSSVDQWPIRPFADRHDFPYIIAVKMQMGSMIISGDVFLQEKSLY
jgi:hypothetical protein